MEATLEIGYKTFFVRGREKMLGGEGLGDLVILIGRGSKTGGRPKLEIVRGPL